MVFKDPTNIKLEPRNWGQQIGPRTGSCILNVRESKSERVRGSESQRVRGSESQRVRASERER